MSRENRLLARNRRVAPADKEVELLKGLAQLGDTRRVQLETAITTRAQYAHNFLTQVNPTVPGYADGVAAAVGLLTDLFVHTRTLVQWARSDTFVPEFSDVLGEIEETIAAAEVEE